jgi:hypothetical protein
VRWQAKVAVKVVLALVISVAGPAVESAFGYLTKNRAAWRCSIVKEPSDGPVVPGLATPRVA